MYFSWYSRLALHCACTFSSEWNKKYVCQDGGWNIPHTHHKRFRQNCPKHFIRGKSDIWSQRYGCDRRNCPPASSDHRVGRVLSFFFSRRNWDSLARLRERGWGPNSDRGHTLWYSIYMCTLWFGITGPNVFCFLSSLPSWHLYSKLTLYIAGAGLPIHMIGKVSWEPKRRRLWAS